MEDHFKLFLKGGSPVHLIWNPHCFAAMKNNAGSLLPIFGLRKIVTLFAFFSLTKRAFSDTNIIVVFDEFLKKKRGRIMSKELIRLRNLVMEFDGERILDGINLYINDHEFLTLLGPSGCGKTTTLRIIGGFLTPTSGEVLFDDQIINDVPPYKRQINTVFQRYALFPHLDVFDNIAFGLKVAKVPKAEISERVHEMLAIVGLKGYENRRIDALSGGQQQRVAIARALVNRPKVLLLDEPLGALDLRLRKDMQNELKRIQQAMGITFIYVTHDQEEALSMSDTVVVMDKGRIQQIGRPEDIYNEPKNALAGLLTAWIKALRPTKALTWSSARRTSILCRPTRATW